MRPIRRVFCVAIALLLPLSAAALEEPDAVYARFHRAIVAGDLEEMLKYAPDAQKAELAALSPAQKAASVKMMAALIPKAYVLRGKNVAPGGQGARLSLSGAGPALIGDKPETLYGNIRMVVQRGEWKVASTEWSSTAPGPLSAPEPKPAARPAAAGKSPVVGGLGSAPERKLGVQKPPCVYKPVMTAEDVENCR